MESRALWPCNFEVNTENSSRKLFSFVVELIPIAPPRRASLHIRRFRSFTRINISKKGKRGRGVLGRREEEENHFSSWNGKQFHLRLPLYRYANRYYGRWLRNYNYRTARNVVPFSRVARSHAIFCFVDTFSRGPWTSSIRCLDTFISFQNFSKRITHIYVYSQGCFRNVSRIERRFSFLFLEMRFVFDNSIVQASSKYSSYLLAVTIGGNLDEPRLSKPVFHWTVPAYRSRYNCSKANIRD